MTATPAQAKLEPCPFCTGELELLDNHAVWHKIKDGFLCPLGYVGIEISQWNRRQSPSQPIARGATPYDAAVEAIAPYLPDGWVAQDEDGRTDSYNIRPTIVLGSVDGQWCCPGGGFSTLNPRLPKAKYWNQSLRHIAAGRVVGNGEDA